MADPVLIDVRSHWTLPCWTERCAHWNCPSAGNRAVKTRGDCDTHFHRRVRNWLASDANTWNCGPTSAGSRTSNQTPRWHCWMTFSETHKRELIEKLLKDLEKWNLKKHKPWIDLTTSAEESFLVSVAVGRWRQHFHRRRQPRRCRPRTASDIAVWPMELCHCSMACARPSCDWPHCNSRIAACSRRTVPTTDCRPTVWFPRPVKEWNVILSVTCDGDV